MREPPARGSNPFATCWTAPAALPYAAVDGVTPSKVVERLLEAGWRGQVLGPHGSGKSTLLAALAEPLVAAGRRPVAPADACGVADEVLLVEGFERLPPREQRRRLAAWRRDRVAFIVTSHRPVRSRWRTLPVLAELRPTPDLLRRLFERLIRHHGTPVTGADAIASYERRDGDLRQVWFDLYDLHERRTRQGRTAVVRVA